MTEKCDEILVTHRLLINVNILDNTHIQNIRIHKSGTQPTLQSDLQSVMDKISSKMREHFLRDNEQVFRLPHERFSHECIDLLIESSSEQDVKAHVKKCLEEHPMQVIDLLLPLAYLADTLNDESMVSVDTKFLKKLVDLPQLKLQIQAIAENQQLSIYQRELVDNFQSSLSDYLEGNDVNRDIDIDFEMQTESVQELGIISKF